MLRKFWITLSMVVLFSNGALANYSLNVMHFYPGLTSVEAAELHKIKLNYAELPEELQSVARKRAEELRMKSWPVSIQAKTLLDYILSDTNSMKIDKLPSNLRYYVEKYKDNFDLLPYSIKLDLEKYVIHKMKNDGLDTSEESQAYMKGKEKFITPNITSRESKTADSAVNNILGIFQ